MILTVKLFGTLTSMYLHIPQVFLWESKFLSDLPKRSVSYFLAIYVPIPINGTFLCLNLVVCFYLPHFRSSTHILKSTVEGYLSVSLCWEGRCDTLLCTSQNGGPSSRLETTSLKNNHQSIHLHVTGVVSGVEESEVRRVGFPFCL